MHGSTRRSSRAMAAWDTWNDPNLENDYATFDVFIIGRRVK